MTTPGGRNLDYKAERQVAQSAAFTVLYGANAAANRGVGRRPDGSLLLRVAILDRLGKLFGVQFHVGGWPYGAAYERSITYEPSDDSNESHDDHAEITFAGGAAHI